jgi:hypothetical protein
VDILANCFYYPEQNLGLFVACNNNPSSLPDELVGKFLDHYYPVDKKPAPIPQRIASSQEHLQKLSGTYRYNRYPHHTLEKLGGLFSEKHQKFGHSLVRKGTLSLYVPEFKSGGGETAIISLSLLQRSHGISAGRARAHHLYVH